MTCNDHSFAKKEFYLIQFVMSLIDSDVFCRCPLTFINKLILVSKVCSNEKWYCMKKKIETYKCIIFLKHHISVKWVFTFEKIIYFLKTYSVNKISKTYKCKITFHLWKNSFPLFNKKKKMKKIIPNIKTNEVVILIPSAFLFFKKKLRKLSTSTFIHKQTKSLCWFQAPWHYSFEKRNSN